jgi:hypothetical protein
MNVTLVGLEQLTQDLNELQKNQIPFALARALTTLGRLGKAITQQNIDAKVDTPTPFTQRAAFTQGPSGDAIVKKGETSVTFGVLPIQAGYLEAQYFGGSSNLRPFETRFEGRHLIPTSNATKDAYGNVPKSFVAKALGDAKAKRNGYYMTKNTVRFRPKGQESVKLFQILDKAPVYKPQLSLDEAIDSVIDAWPSVFTKELAFALNTAKR